MKKTLVVPSIREECFKRFMEEWENKGDWDEVILIEDNPQKTFSCSNEIIHYSWNEIESFFKDKSWIFSKRDSAIRSSGFYIAYIREADYILTLDDDCYPAYCNSLFNMHIYNMNSYEKWIESIPGMRTRGIPYKSKGKLNNVVANMGLWTGYPDLDAPHSLHCPELADGEDYHPAFGNRLIPNGQYFPLCGMNFCFKREVAPLAYFPLMGQDQSYSRFDDIWFGIIFKKIIDHLGWNVSVGEPFVNHQKASNVFTNLRKEAPGIEANEWFWEKIDEMTFTAGSPKYCMEELGGHIENDENEYISKLGKAILVWSSMF